MNDKMTEKGLVKYTIISLLLGIILMVILFIIYLMSKDSNIIAYLYELTNGYQKDFSEQYLVVTTIASTYTKAAPIFVILMYVSC